VLGQSVEMLLIPARSGWISALLVRPWGALAI
jgi:hypothetical protein